MAEYPVNFLDKVKFELDKYNSPQYFIQFWQLKGKLENQRLQQAFNDLYQQLPKLSQRLMYENGNYHYRPDSYQNTFITKETNDCTIDTLKIMLQQNLETIVHQANNAPVIAIKIEQPSDGSTLLCLLFNHVFCDAPSGYLIKELLVANYNGTKSDIPETVTSLSDEEFITQKAPDSATFNTSLEEYRSLSASYLSEANQVNLFYQENASNTVNFEFCLLNTKRLIRDKGTSLNSLISSAIAKAVLELKADILKGSISLSITTNIRDNSDTLFGNYVSAIPVKLEQADMRTMTTTFQQHITGFTSVPQRALLSYASLAYGFSEATPQQIIDGFRLISSKSNAYISNFGPYNRNQDQQLTFNDTKLIVAGGFNFPLQGNYGLIFTLVPCGNKLGLGIAASPSIFSSDDLEKFKSLVQQNLLPSRDQ